MTEQVKYFTDDGEKIVTRGEERGTDGVIPAQTAMFENSSPWPAIVFVLASFAIIALTVLGIVSILHG